MYMVYSKGDRYREYRATGSSGGVNYSQLDTYIYGVKSHSRQWMTCDTSATIGSDARCSQTSAGLGPCPPTRAKKFGLSVELSSRHSHSHSSLSQPLLSPPLGTCARLPPRVSAISTTHLVPTRGRQPSHAGSHPWPTKPRMRGRGTRPCPRCRRCCRPQRAASLPPSCVSETGLHYVHRLIIQ